MVSTNQIPILLSPVFIIILVFPLSILSDEDYPYPPEENFLYPLHARSASAPVPNRQVLSYNFTNINSTSWYIHENDTDCCTYIGGLGWGPVACFLMRQPDSWKITGPSEGVECIKPVQVAIRLGFNKCCLNLIKLKYAAVDFNQTKGNLTGWDIFLNVLKNPSQIAKDFSSDRCFAACFLHGTRAMTISSDRTSVKFEKNHIAEITKNFNDNSFMYGHINRLWNNCIDSAEKEVPEQEKRHDFFPCYIAARFYTCMITSAAQATKDISLCDEPDDITLMESFITLLNSLS